MQKLSNVETEDFSDSRIVALSRDLGSVRAQLRSRLPPAAQWDHHNTLEPRRPSLRLEPSFLRKFKMQRISIVLTLFGLAASQDFPGDSERLVHLSIVSMRSRYRAVLENVRSSNHPVDSGDDDAGNDQLLNTES